MSRPLRSDNAPDSSRGLAGYITAYQGVAAAPDAHLREFRYYSTLLVVDEVHNLLALADTDPTAAAEAAMAGEDFAGAWSRSILPLLECAGVRLLLSGTLAPTAPLALHPFKAQATPHGPMRFVPLGEELVLQAQLGEAWQHIYRVMPLPRVDAEYEVANWFAATHPAAPSPIIRWRLGLPRARRG